MRSGRRHAQKPFARPVRGNLLGDDFGPRERKALAKLFKQRPRNVAHGGKLGDATMVDPMPELGGAHVELALGHADLGKRAHDFGARRAGEAQGRAVQGMSGGGGHGAGF